MKITDYGSWTVVLLKNGKSIFLFGIRERKEILKNFADKDITDYYYKHSNLDSSYIFRIVKYEY